MRDRNRGEFVAVRSIDLDVRPGELMTLLGPSGCGKTTTLRMIAGFQEPSAGRISIAGQDVTHVPANHRDIGFVFQNYALFPHLTVHGNVAYGLEARGKTPARYAAPSPMRSRWWGWMGLAPTAGRALRRPATTRRARPRHRDPAARPSV